LPDARRGARRDDDVVRPTALVVDDHAMFRGFARRLLIAAGYEVVAEAADAAGGLVEAARWRPSFVLLDVLLPDASGIEIADQISAAGGSAVLLTSSRTEIDLGPAVAGRWFVTKSELTVERVAGPAGGGGAAR
jgi:CheY-like chemotaxis protein